MSRFEVILISLALLILILLAAFFACAETGLMAVNRYRLRHKAYLKKRYAERVLKLLKRPDRLLGAILIGSTFASMLASSLATLLAIHFWGDKGAIFAVFLLTFFVLIFAEIAPKTLAAMYPEQVARWVSYPIQFVLKVIYPAVWVVNVITNKFLRLMHIHMPSSSAEPLSRDELRTLVYDTSGKISRQYQNMLLGILDLNKLTVDDVMIPRYQITGIDINQSWDVIIEELNKLKQDWIPVYRDNINQITGILYIHDILDPILKGVTPNQNLIEQHLKPPFFVPETTSLYVQLGNFQKGQDKIAFVVDEYGEIKGMLTMNDILEEIVGDFTSAVPLSKRIKLQKDGSYWIEGSMSVREFNRVTGWALPVTGPKTFSGLIIEYLESLPRKGTTILINDYPIEIMEVKKNNVRFAKIFPKLIR